MRVIRRGVVITACAREGTKISATMPSACWGVLVSHHREPHDRENHICSPPTLLADVDSHGHVRPLLPSKEWKRSVKEFAHLPYAPSTLAMCLIRSTTRHE